MVKRGQTANEKQRYLCRNPDCSAQTFILDYDDLGRIPTIKKQITEMALNGSGIRDTARVLHISPSTVISELKKRIQSRVGQPRCPGTAESKAYSC